MKHQSLGTYVVMLLIGSAFAGLSAGCGQMISGDGSNIPPGQGGGAGEYPWDDNRPADYTYRFKATGQNAARQFSNNSAMTVSTDGTLIVAINAGAGLPLENSGFSVGFNCEWFTVRVGNVVRTAFVKKEYYNNVPQIRGWMPFDVCAAAPKVWHFDFSSAVQGATGPVNVEISAAQYDNCAGMSRPDFNGVDHGGCYQHPVIPSHSVDGQLRVYTH